MKQLLEKMHDLYTESIQNQVLASSMLTESLAQGAKKMVETLLSGHKIIVCGQGKNYALAQILVANLLHKCELTRPSFPAVLLSLDGAVFSAISQENPNNNPYLRQFEAVSKAGDLLIIFNEDNTPDLLEIMQNANEKDVNMLAITANHNERVKSYLAEKDIEITVPAQKASRVLEQHLFISNILCELVDFSLFSQN